MNIVLPYVKKGGHFIAMKGPLAMKKMKEAKKAITVLGGMLKEIIETQIVDEEIKHNIIVIEKLINTPSNIQGRFSIIENNPIK